MTAKQFVLFITIMCLVTSCLKTKKDYVTITDYVDKTNRLDGRFTLDKDTLFIFFEENFNHDTLELEVGQERRKIFLTTNHVLSLAEVQTFGNIQNISDFEISLNGRQTHRVDIKDKLMNKWAVKFYQDTLRITVLKYAPFYD